MRDVIRLLLLCGCVLALCSTLFAQSEQLEEINLQVNEHTIELDAIRNQLAQLDQEVREVRTSIQGVQKEKKTLETALQANEDIQANLSARIQEIERKQENVRALSLRRIRALYLSRQSGAVERLLLVGDSPYIGRQAIFLKAVHDFDRDLLSHLRELSNEKAKQRADLDVVLDEQRSIQERLGGEQKKLSAKLSQQSTLVAELNKQRVRIEQALTALRAQALRLETVLSSMTSAPERARAGAEPVQSQNQEQSPEPFDGAGLRAGAAGLVLPVEGKVVRKFGTKQGEEFDDMVRSKGVEFLCPEVQLVRAIAAGRVIFAGNMPGFSRVVIVDHGKRTYSLYGRLSEFIVKRGDEVETSETLGQTSSEAEEGSHFYFEIRDQGRPVDPKRFFKKLG